MTETHPQLSFLMGCLMVERNTFHPVAIMPPEDEQEAVSSPSKEYLKVITDQNH